MSTIFCVNRAKIIKLRPTRKARVLMIPSDTLMMDLADQGGNPAEEDPRFILEINQGRCEAVIVFRECLAFHADLAAREEEHGIGKHAIHKWTDLVDARGYLTDDAAEQVASAMSHILREKKISGVTVEYASGLEFDDEPSMALELISTFGKDETYDSWLDRIGWPAISCVINAVDPGTFNFPYLFSALMYR